MSSSKQDIHFEQESISTKGLPYFRIRLGIVFTILGFLLFLLGARPSIFGLDRSPVIGFVQIGMFLVGLAIMCLGGYISMMALWN